MRPHLIILALPADQYQALSAIRLKARPVLARVIIAQAVEICRALPVPRPALLLTQQPPILVVAPVAGLIALIWTSMLVLL